MDESTFEGPPGAGPDPELLRRYREAERAGVADAYSAAIEAGDAEGVRRQIADWPILARSAIDLIRAVRLGRAEIVADLLRAGTPAGVPDELGITPLMYAAGRGDLEVVRMLVEAGADPNALMEDVDPLVDPDQRGQSALHSAAWHGHEDLVNFLRPLTDPWLRARAELAAPDRAGAAEEDLDRAAAAGDIEGLRAALEDGADVGARTGEERRTALHAAAGAGHAGLVAALLDAGAAIDARDESGRTALWRAAGRGHLEVVRLLLRRGADPEGRDFEAEQTPLIQAVLADRAEVVADLLAAGADPRATDVDGLSALDFAEYQDVPAARATLLSRTGRS
jgi:ankyrin repeat protein